jgi:hypothetical protein
MFIFEAFNAWKECRRPAVVETYGEDDDPALSESWNNFTDFLCKDGKLNALQYDHAPAYDDEDMPKDCDEERAFILDEMGVKFGFQHIAERPDAKGGPWENDHSTSHYIVTISRGENGFTTYYTQGIAHTSAPNREAVLHSVLMDASGLYDGVTFEDWASEFGFDEGSRGAERMFKACQKIGADLQKLFTTQEIEDLNEIFADF